MKSLALALVLALSSLGAQAADAPMSAVEIATRVRATVAEILGKRPVDIEAARALAAQGADELDIVEIIMALEEKFDVAIPDETIEGDGGTWTALSVNRLAQIIQKLKRHPQPRP